MIVTLSVIGLFWPISSYVNKSLHQGIC